MSYDVALGFDAGGQEPLCTEFHNYTSNLLGAWTAAGAPLASMHGLTGRVAGPRLRRSAALLRRHPERFVEHEPENGWGNIGGCADFLDAIAADCERYPRAHLMVWPG